MKKLIIMTMALFAAATATTQAQQLANNSDSLGYYIGAMQGTGISEKVASTLSADKFDAYRQAYLEGLKIALLADTAKVGFDQGLREGAMMLEELKRMYVAGMPVNRELFYQTFDKFFTGKQMPAGQLSHYTATLRQLLEPMQQYYQRQQQQAQEAQMKQIEAEVQANLAAGEKFMAELKANDPTVVTTPSGLVYKVLTQGEGPTVGPDQSALLNYTGRLVSGKEFDATNGKPVKLMPSQVIRGFGEGLQLMNKGSKYILYIPADIAYGMQGPPVIGPAQTLIFEVEILDIIPANAE